MIGQPSVNDLASMFQGNPGPLQAKVNQDMQGQPPGTLPKDLRDLLALQIVTNEQDAAKRNAAMQQLQQMQPQGPQGEPPTVAQSLQQQAQQKLQARMMQQQMQSQQGIQGLAQIPQPQHQPQPEPQGLDMLQSGIGENYAGGGIIAFNGEDESEVPEARPLRYESAQDRAEEYIRRKMEARARDEAEARRIEALAATIPGQNVQAPQGGERALSTESERNIANILSAMPGAGAARAFAGGARGLMGILGGLLGGDQTRQPEAPPQAAAPAQEPVRGRPTMATDPRLLTTPQGQNLAAVDRMTSDVSRPPAPARQGLPVAVTPPAAAPAVPVLSEREKFLAQQFATRPDADTAEQEYETKVGRRSTAGLEAAAAELRAQKERIAKRLQDNQSFSEYMRQIAMTPRGLTSAAAGSYGAEGVRRREQALEDQNLAMLQNILKTEETIEDIKHGYKKEKYGVGKDAVNKAYDRTFKAAELMGYDERQAKEMAFKAAENVKDRQNEIARARIAADARTGGAGEKQTLNELKALQSSIAAQLKDPRMMGPKGDPLRQQLQQINAAIAQMAGIGTMAGAPSAPSPGGNRPPLSSFQR
jgi:hypothetical protein